MNLLYCRHLDALTQGRSGPIPKPRIIRHTHHLDEWREVVSPLPLFLDPTVSPLATSDPLILYGVHCHPLPFTLRLLGVLMEIVIGWLVLETQLRHRIVTLSEDPHAGDQANCRTAERESPQPESPPPWRENGAMDQ